MTHQLTVFLFFPGSTFPELFKEHFTDSGVFARCVCVWVCVCVRVGVWGGVWGGVSGGGGVGGVGGGVGGRSKQTNTDKH